MTTDVNGCSRTDQIDIIEPGEVIAKFTPSVTTAYLSNNGEVHFNNSSSGSGSFKWNFGDGSQSNSDKNPTHYYNELGVFYVALLASTGICEDTYGTNISVLKSDVSTIDESLTDEGMRLLQVGNGLYELTFMDGAVQNFELIVTNLIGQQFIRINEKASGVQTYMLDLSNQPASIYIIHLTTDEFRRSYKFYKNN